MLLTIAYLIAKNDTVYREYLTNVLLKIEECGTVLSLWKTLFTDFFDFEKCQSSVYMVIDGIDELDHKDQVEVLQSITELCQKRGKNDVLRISVLIVGRPEITRHLPAGNEASPPEIVIGPNKNKDDIDCFITTTIARSKHISRSKTLSRDIEQKLTSDANGSFLWTQLMLTELEEKAAILKSKAVRKSLNNLPSGLSEALQQILKGYSKYKPDEVQVLIVGMARLMIFTWLISIQHLLTWVIYAQWPLYIRQLDESLRLGSTGQSDIRDLENTINKFPSFFTITDARGGSLASKGSEGNNSLRGNIGSEDASSIEYGSYNNSDRKQRGDRRRKRRRK